MSDLAPGTLVSPRDDSCRSTGVQAHAPHPVWWLIGGSLAVTIDPFLYTLQATIRPDRTPEEVLSALDVEIQRVLDSPLEPAEVAKAIKQARALFAYGSESITNQAFWLGYSEMFADYAWFEGYVDRLAAVTPEEIMGAARKYLAPSNRVVGIYRPTGGGAHA